jgi:hypothetical protein
MVFIDGLCNAAALHMLYENDPAIGQRNVYASLTYGRDVDLRSIPKTVEIVQYGGFTALRKRLTRAEAKLFIDAARTGTASIDGYTIAFDLDEEVCGFRPGCAVEPPNQRSPFPASMWTREHIGRVKSADGVLLTRSSVWPIKDRLRFLDESRWTAIILRNNPEKIGDLDEWWPTPVEVTSNCSAGQLRVTLQRNILPAHLHSAIRVSCEIYANGLESAHAEFQGAGPYGPKPMDANGSRVTLTVDDVVLDRQSGYYVRSIGLNLQVSSNQTWTIPARGRRPAVSFPISASAIRTTAGQIPRHSARAVAWNVGDYARTSVMPADAEFVYDPDRDPAHTLRALSDLQTLNSAVHQPRVRIIDPYVLDEPAMETIAAIASRAMGASVIELFCGFAPPPSSIVAAARGAVGWAGAALAIAAVSSGTKRQREQDRARRVAESIRSRLGVTTVCYSVKRLHDRFLMIDDRLWHVGPSFNRLGSDFSALVEMRDPRRIAEVVSFMDRNATVANEAFRT